MKIGLALILWFIAVLLAIGNGYLGNTFVASRIGDYGAHIYKSIALIIFIFILAWLFAQQTRGNRWLRSAIPAGLLWFGLTIIFEFIFGHYVLGNSWHDLIRDYRIWEGQLWLLILFSDLFAPLIIGSILNR